MSRKSSDKAPENTMSTALVTGNGVLVSLQSTVLEEEEDGVIYTVVVKQQHVGPTSPVVRPAVGDRSEKIILTPAQTSTSSLFPSSSHGCLAPSVWKQEQRRSWCSTSSTPSLWETRPSSPSSSPPIAPSPPRSECWTSSVTGNRGFLLLSAQGWGFCLVRGFCFSGTDLKRHKNKYDSDAAAVRIPSRRWCSFKLWSLRRILSRGSSGEERQKAIGEFSLANVEEHWGPNPICWVSAEMCSDAYGGREKRWHAKRRVYFQGTFSRYAPTQAGVQTVCSCTKWNHLLQKWTPSLANPFLYEQSWKYNWMIASGWWHLLVSRWSATALNRVPDTANIFH